MSKRFLLAPLLAGVIACAPSLTTPGEATRLSGTVEAPGEGPVHIVVLERCSSRWVFFERCPGKFLGEAKLWKPGPYVIEFDTDKEQLAIYAFRGEAGVERQCAVTLIDTESAREPLPITLQKGTCGTQTLHEVEGVGAPPPPAGATSSPAPPLDEGPPL